MFAQYHVIPKAPVSLEEWKEEARRRIDAATSAAILAGFECEATPPDAGEPELLHFSYDSFDQQNFADAALSMQLAAASGDIPTATPWNAYRDWTPESGGELVVLQHKAGKMAAGSERKAAVETADSAEAVQALLVEWDL